MDKKVLVAGSGSSGAHIAGLLSALGGLVAVNPSPLFHGKSKVQKYPGQSERNIPRSNSGDSCSRGSRQQVRALRFRSAFAGVRKQHGGSGLASAQFTYVEGMNRKAARRIARVLAKSNG